MDIEKIKELVEFLSHTDVSELSFESDGVKVSIKKGTAYVPQPVATAPAPAPAQAEKEAVAVEQPAAAAAAEADAALISVPAPMVGTFYRAPDPEADPYVKEGDLIQVGQPLCIIEAMKLMNEIESEVRGRIVKILVEDGEPVEYGEPLFLIDAEG